MGLKQYVTSFGLIGIFALALIGFAMNFAIDNDASFSIVDDTEISKLSSDLQDTSFNKDAEDTYKSIIETTIDPGSQTAQSVGPFAVTLSNPLGPLTGVKNILQVGYVKIFGSKQGFGIFLSLFIGLLIFGGGLLLYKALRGFPD